MADITQSFSQLLLTYGPGAMLDLPDHAVVVAGLGDWQYSGTGWRPVEEERLVALLKQQLGEKLSPQFNGLRQPPVYDEERHDNHAPGVAVRLFPTWFIVDEAATALNDSADQNTGDRSERRRRIVPFEELSVSKAGKLSIANDKKKMAVNPIRFVAACAKGHLQDIDWRRLAHRNGDHSCRKQLFWIERGVSSDPSDISIRCSCGAFVTLADLYKPKFLGRCECHSPWLTPRRVAEDTCNEDLKLLPRSATNTYFSQSVSVISLTKSDDRVRQVLSENWTNIEGIQSMPNFLDILRAMPQLREAFKEFTDDEIMRGLTARASSDNATIENPRIAEFDLLSSGNRYIGSDATGSVLFAETLNRSSLTLPHPWGTVLQNVVKVHRLREVICLYGFTRLEPPPSSADGELDEIQLAVDGAPLARHIEWLPALEQFGEGIFLHMSPEYMKNWLQKSEVLQKAQDMRAAELADAARFGRQPQHRGAAYWALHSLAHAFMGELALECGYPLSSLKERIYASPTTMQSRYAILIYTSTSGGSGTLGGLSNMAEQSGILLSRAVERLALCSNDPICAEQQTGNNEQALLGAACHACLLIPETSCEARNTRLDRSLLVGTLVSKKGVLIET